jgi:hypothetical protein
MPEDSVSSHRLLKDIRVSKRRTTSPHRRQPPDISIPSGRGALVPRAIPVYQPRISLSPRMREVIPTLPLMRGSWRVQEGLRPVTSLKNSTLVPSTVKTSPRGLPMMEKETLLLPLSHPPGLSAIRDSIPRSLGGSSASAAHIRIARSLSRRIWPVE